MVDRDDVEVTVEILRESEKAYQVTDGDTICWLPRSQVKDMEFLRGTTHEMLIPEWLATEKGLI